MKRSRMHKFVVVSYLLCAIMCARVLSHPLHVDASSAASEGCTSLKVFYAQSSVTSEVLCLNGATMSYETHEQLRVRVYHRNVVPKVPSAVRSDVAEQLRNNIHQILMERCPAQQSKQATFSVQHTSLHSLLMVTPGGVAREALARLPCYQSDSCGVTVCQRAARNTSVLGAKLLSRRRTRSSLMYGGGGDHQVTLSSQECIGIGWAVELTETMMTHAMEEQLLNNSGGDNRAGRLVLHKEGRDGALLCCTTSGSNEAQEGCSINYSALTSTLSHPAVSHAELLTAPKIVMKYSRGLVQSGQEFVEPLNELLGLKGEGYVIGVSDTGIDTDHCFFWDGSVDVPYDTHSTAHRKLVRYQAYGGRDANSRGDFNPGHGTHVAGTLAGSIATTAPSDTAEASTFHGAAPAAKLSFLDLSGPSAGEGIQSRSVESLAALVVIDGASVMSNSWGGELAEYTVSCASIDRYIYETKRSLTVFFAAGNEADRNCNAHPLLPLCDRFTVMAPSTSKNVISVGSSEATMNSWAHADLANYILTVGDNALTFFLLKGTGGPSFPTTIPSKQVLLAEPHNLCNVPTGASYKDTILVAYRGTCTFETKTQNAIAAGAAALIVINIIPGHGTVMGCPDEACASYAINSFMIAQDDGDALVAALQAHGSEMVFASISVTTKEMPDRSIDTLSSFSSHGPSLDGRYKPDLVAVGEMLHSAKSDGNLNSQNCDFWASQGTSMATPLLAGHAVLVQEYLARLHQPAITAPSSALIKAMFVQAARPLRGRYERNFQGDWRSLGETPNFEEGHGFPVLSTILPLNTTSTEATRLSPQLFLVDEVELSSATAVHRYHLSYDGSQAAFQATLAWIDPPGSPSPGSARSMLINNLDLRVLYNASDDDGVSLRYGNAKLDCNPSVRAASSADVLNNVEKVRLVGAPAGDYIVEVVAMHLATSGQKYSLVASGERRESATDTTACPVSHPLFASDPLPAVACGGRGACVGGVCHCDPEWSGAACSTPMPTLAAWETVTMLVEPLAWSMFRLETPLLVSGESLTTTITWSNLSPMSDVDIAVCEGRIPTIDLMNDPSPAPQECVAVDRTADNNDAVINDQLPKEAKTITFQADSGAVYYLGVVAMCCFPSNVTLTMTQGATRASAVRLSTSEIPFNSATNKIPIELVFASKSNGSHRDHQRTVAFHGPASFLTKQSSLFAENHELVLQVRHPRTSELMVNGSCIVINSTTELCSPYASCWMCTATTMSVITSSTTPSNGVLMFANCSSASSCTVFSVPHPSTYRLLFDDNAPEDSSSAPDPATNAPVTSSSSSSSSSDSQSSSSASSDAAHHHHHEHNFTFTFRFRGKMGNCIPLQEDSSSCKMRNTAVIPNTATGVSYFDEDPPILPELALVLDAPAPALFAFGNWWSPGGTGTEDPPVVALDLLDPITNEVLRGLDAWRVELECIAQRDLYAFVCPNITGLTSGRAYRVSSKNIVQNPAPLHERLIVWVSPTPTISSLSLERFTHFSNPLTLSFPQLNTKNMVLFLQGTFLLPEVPSGLEGEDEHSEDVREYLHLDRLTISFGSASGMFDDIVCNASLIVTSSLLQCSLDELPAIPDGTEFLVTVRSPTWYASMMGYVTLVLAPRPRIIGIISSGQVDTTAPLSTDASITFIGDHFPSVPQNLISAALLGSSIPTAAMLSTLGSIDLRSDLTGQVIRFVTQFQNETHLVVSAPFSTYTAPLSPFGLSGQRLHVQSTFDIVSDLTLTSPSDRSSMVRVSGVTLATQAMIDKPSLAANSLLASSPAHLVLTQPGDYLWIGFDKALTITITSLEISLLALSPQAVVSASSTIVLDSRCAVKPQLSSSNDHLVCRLSPYLLQNVSYALSMRITDRIARFPFNTSMSFSSQGGSSTQLPFATLSVEGVPLSVGAASYFSKENAGPDSSLIFVEQPSNCDNPLVQVGGVKVATAPAKENPSATVFSATPQFPAALVHPCYSNGSLKATLRPPAGHLSDAPQGDDFFYIPLDPMLWTTKSIAQITSVVLLPIDEGTINPVESRVDISSSSQIFELQRTSLSSPINITIQVSDIAVNAVGGVDEEEPAFFLYLGAEVVDAPPVTRDSGEVAGGSSANWFPCNASRVHIFGQADSISSDLRQHTFQDVRILGDIIPVNDETKTAKHVRLCVEFSTTQSSASLMPKTHFSSILTVINPCGVACDLQGGECLTTPTNGDRCVCKSLFTGSDCSLLCPTTVASEGGVRVVCSGAGTCGVDLLSPSRNDGVTSSMCYCDGHRSGALCEIEEISQVFALSSATSVVAAPTDVSWVGPLVLQSGASISATFAELRVDTSATSESIALLIAPDPISVLSSTSACKYASALISLLDDQTNQSTVIGTIPLALTTSLLAEWVVLPTSRSSSTLTLRVQLVGAAYPSSPDAHLRCVVSAGLVTLDPTHSTLPWLASSSPNTTTLLRYTNTTVYQCGTSPSSCRVVYGIVVAIACLVTLLCFMMVVRLKHRISLLEWR